MSSKCWLILRKWRLLSKTRLLAILTLFKQIESGKNFAYYQIQLSQAKSIFSQRHPFGLLFHLLFRTLAILLYIFSTLFIKNFITIFVIIIILLSLDFWTVKNITGRLLVGLRWWNHVDEEGKSNWIFENRKNNSNQSNKMTSIIESTFESNIFWASLIVADLIWMAFFFISFLTFNFKWMVLKLFICLTSCSLIFFSSLIFF